MTYDRLIWYRQEAERHESGAGEPCTCSVCFLLREIDQHIQTERMLLEKLDRRDASLGALVMSELVVTDGEGMGTCVP